MTEDNTRPPETVPPRDPPLARSAPPRREEERTNSREGEREPDRPTPGYGAMPYGQALYPLYQPGADSAPDIGKIFQLLWRHKWLPILCVAATVAGAVWYLRTAEPVYASSALVELSVRRPRIMRQEDALIQEQGRMTVDELYNTQVMKLRGAALRARVTQAMQEAGQAPDALAPWLDNTDIKLVRKSSLVSITAEHTDPAVASRLANAYAREAVAHALDENKALSEQAVRWLRTQADAQRVELEEVDRKVLRLRNEHSLDSLAVQQTMKRDALLAVNTDSTLTRTALTRHTQMLDHLQAIAKGDDPAQPLPEATPGLAEIVGLLNRLREQRVERDTLLRDYTPQHPSVKDKDEHIRSTLDAVTRVVARALGTVRSDVALLQAQHDALAAKQDALAAELDALERRARAAQTEQDALERQRDASRASYQGVLIRIEEARLSADEQTATIKLVEEARVPERPSRPRPLRLFAVAVLLGGILGVGAAFLAETLGNRVWEIDDITRSDSCSVRVLGAVPRADRKCRAGLDRIAIDHKFSPVSESFTTLHGVLNAMECGSTLVVTSPAPGEGKTTCACNLAVGFAQAGQRTLLLDMDMRRPRVKRVWGIEERESSLLHALGDEPMPDFAALTHETDVKGLDVIVSQHSSQFSPSEIIGKPRTRELIDWARAHYDRVVIDSPPVGIAADAMLLGGLADSVLVVIRFNRTRKSALGAAVEQLRRGKANVLGVVVNDVAFSKFGYGYRHPMYSYYSGYHAYSKYVVADARASREKQA